MAVSAESFAGSDPRRRPDSWTEERLLEALKDGRPLRLRRRPWKRRQEGGAESSTSVQVQNRSPLLRGDCSGRSCSFSEAPRSSRRDCFPGGRFPPATHQQQLLYRLCFRSTYVTVTRQPHFYDDRSFN